MADEYTEMLRNAGLRVTAARVAVLRSIDKLHHADADQIRECVHERLGSVSGQAIYDALNGLTRIKVLRRIEPAGCRARYEINVGDNHHHLVCTECGKMEDVPCMTGHAPCLHPEEIPPTWQLERAEVIYWGICPTCREKATSAAPMDIPVVAHRL